MSDDPRFDFTPVPLRGRRDDWLPETQAAFIAALARGVPMFDAARLVGKSRTAAYALRHRPGAESFAAAWVAALNYAKEKRGDRARSD